MALLPQWFAGHLKMSMAFACAAVLFGAVLFPFSPHTATAQVVAPSQPVLTLRSNDSVDEGTKFTISGELKTSSGTQLEGREITLDGTGIPSIEPVTVVTQGIKFNHSASDGVRIDSCASCTPSGDILYLKLGGEIIFPDHTLGVIIDVQDIGDGSVTVNVTKTDEVSFNATTQGYDTYVAHFGIFSDSGITKITFTELLGPTDPSGVVPPFSDRIGISAVKTYDLLGEPQLQRNVTFTSVASSNPLPYDAGNITLAGGSFFHTVLSTGAAGQNLTVQAHYTPEGTDVGVYNGVDSGEIHHIIFPSSSAAGGGGELPASSVFDYRGLDYTTYSCGTGNDDDLDGLCDTWETYPTTSTSGVRYTRGDGTYGYYKLCFTDEYSNVWGGSNNQYICARPDHRDIFVELDSMTGNPSPPYTPNSDAVKAVITAFGNTPLTNAGVDQFNRPGGITLHVDSDDTQIPYEPVIYAWKDKTIAGVPYDSNDNNDFVQIKKKNFGNSTQRIAQVSATQTNTVVDSTYSGGAVTNGVRFTITGVTVSTTDLNVKGKVTLVSTVTFSGDPGALTVAASIVPGTTDPTLSGVAVSSATVSMADPAFPSKRTVTVKVSFSVLPAAGQISNDLLGTINVDLTKSTAFSQTLLSCIGSNCVSPGPTVSTTLQDAKALAYHYGLMARTYGDSPDDCGPSGLAEVDGNDFLITLGCGFTGTNGSVDEQAGTIMHELGHNLGLGHGGPLTNNGSPVASSNYNANCKPNYASVMSYPHQFPTYYASSAEWNQKGLDYSTMPFATLTEGTSTSGQLNEPNGLATATEVIIYGTPVKWGAGTYNVVSPAVNIDWEKDLWPWETTAYEDINNFGSTMNCGSSTSLTSYADWPNLKYNFRPATGSFDGVLFHASKQREVNPEMYAEMKAQRDNHNTLEFAFKSFILTIIGIIIILIIIAAAAGFGGGYWYFRRRRKRGGGGAGGSISKQQPQDKYDESQSTPKS